MDDPQTLVAVLATAVVALAMLSLAMLKGWDGWLELRRLEQRVRVLERIVTDKGIEVADEIERLRDQPLN